MNTRLLALTICATIFAGSFTTQPVHAQDATPPQVTAPQLHAEIGDDRSTIVGRSVVFDSSASINSDNSPLTYNWDFGDGAKITTAGGTASHEYAKPGDYAVRFTVNTQAGTSSYDEIVVSVFDHIDILVTDTSTDAATVKQFERFSARQGRLLFTIADRSGNGDFLQEAQLTQILLANTDFVRKADTIITWTSGNTGLNILSQFAQAAHNLSDLNFAHKTVIVLTDQNFGVIARTAQSAFDLLRPESIILTRPQAMGVISDATISQRGTLAQTLQKASVEYSVIGIHSERGGGKLGPLNFLSYLVNYMVNKGIPINTITLILIFPIIATIIVLARQIIGLKAFGIYAPAIITLSFLALGIKIGLIILAVVLGTGTLVRFILKRFHFFYFPKMALVLTAVALSLLGVLATMAFFNMPVVATSFFPMLLLIIIVEKFISVQIEKGSFEALMLSLETVLLSVLSYYILSWDVLQSFVINYPEIILLVVVINLVIGRWTGLRLFELLRFREALRFHEE